MALQIYADSNFTQLIVKVLGYLQGDGTTNSFAVESEPAEVRLYTAGKPYGELLTKNTSTPTTPAAGEWGYDSGIVYLGTVPTSGETVVAFSSGQRIFEGVNTLSGKARFVSNSANENDRTKKQQLWIKNDSASEGYEQITVNCLLDFLSGEGADTSWITFSLDDTTYAAGPLTLPNIDANGSSSFWIKAVVPQNNETMNYRDLTITIDAIEYSLL